MEYVLSCQGDALNKFASIPVDYFDKNTHWADFQDLVRRPAMSYLEFSDSSIAAIYDECAGNPYFAKLICRSLFSMMVERRDGHVTFRDVRQAVGRTLSHVEATSFQHFWTDGIREVGTRAEEISIIRRRVLLCIADCLKDFGTATKEAIESRTTAHQISPSQLDLELRDLERRNVLFCRDGMNGSPTIYSCKIPLFGQWLATRGYQAILTTFVDLQSAAASKRKQETDRVKDEEIATLLTRWIFIWGRG